MQTSLFTPATAPAPAMSTPVVGSPQAQVGRSWDAKEGRRTILRYHEPQGDFTDGAYEIGTAGRSTFFHELVPPPRLERLVFVETSNHAGWLAQQQRAVEQARAEQAEEALYRGFFAAMPPLKAGKARAALELAAGFNGRVMRRKHFILEAVAQGAVSGDTRYGKALMMPDGGFFTARQITQSALDFAAHLLGLAT